MLPPRRREPARSSHKSDDPYELQPLAPEGAPPSAPAVQPTVAAARAQDRSAEILTISVIVALLVLLGLGAAFWALDNRPARAPTPTPTATRPPGNATLQALLATGVPSPLPRATAQPPAEDHDGTPGAVQASPAAPAPGSTSDVRLPIVSLGGANAGGDANADADVDASATPSVPEQTPAVAEVATPVPAASPTAVTISLPFVSQDEVIPTATSTPPPADTPSPPVATATDNSPVVELTGVAPNVTQPAPPPTATSPPSPTLTPFVVDNLKAFVKDQSAPLFNGPSSVFTQTGTLSIDSEIRLYGRNESGEWVYACCVDDKAAWVRQADVRIQDNTLPGEPEDVEPNDVRWLRFVPTDPMLRRLPTPTPIPAGDFPLWRYTPDNRGRIQPLPNLARAAKPWPAEPQAGGSLISPAVVTGSSVIVGSSDGHLYSFDRVNGNQRWRTNIGQLITVSPAVDGDLLYIIDNTGMLRGLHDAGNASEERWSRSMGAPPISGINVFSRTLFINLGQKLVLVNGETGDLVYEFNLPASSQYPTIGGQLLYPTAGPLRAYDVLALIEERRVDQVWEQPGILNVSAPPVYSSPGVKAQAELYVASGNNRIFSLDANTGKELWNQENNNPATGLAVNDTMLFVSGNGYIRALSRLTGDEIWNRGVSGPVLGGVYVDATYLIAYLQNGSFLFADAATGEPLANLAAYPAAATSGAAISAPFVFGPGNDGKLYGFRESP